LLLVGFDGSTAAWRAAAWAMGQARCRRAKLVFVYVRCVPSWVALGPPQLIPLWRANSAELTAGIAAQLTAALAETDVSWEFVARDGRPVAELARMAAVLGADAIIVGARRRRLRWTCRSVPGRLLRKGHWPVTAVP
jgi:nucleotide-binding universal stress UspA family protein